MSLDTAKVLLGLVRSSHSNYVIVKCCSLELSVETGWNCLSENSSCEYVQTKVSPLTFAPHICCEEMWKLVLFFV